MALPNMAMIPSGYKPTKLYSVLPTPENGSEEVTNGDFSDGATDWVIGSGWSISGGSATFTGSAYGASIYQNNVVTLGKTYAFDCDLTDGFFDVRVGSNDYFVYTGQTIYVTPDNSSSLSIVIRPRSSTVTIGNVSVKESITAHADFTVTRATPATRVNQQGLIETPEFIESGDLITNGDFSNGSTDWNLGSGWSIADGKATANNANSFLYQGGVIASNKFYKIQFTILNYVSGSVSSLLNGGGNATGANVSENGTYTQYLNNTSSNGNISLYAQSNFNGSIDNISIVEVERNNIPRLDYTDGTCPVLLTEPQSTNLIPYSEDFSQWDTIGGTTITSNFGISPDGTQNADRVQMNTGDRLFESSSTPNVSFSVYAKSNSGLTHTISMRDGGGIVTYDMVITDEWQRFDIYLNTTMSNVQFRAFEDNIDVLMWGAQVENLPYSTSIIPTNGSISTRNKDIVNNAGTSATYNSVEGVLFAEMAALSQDANFQLGLFGTANAQLRFEFQGGTIRAQLYNGAYQASMSFATTLTDNHKIAFKYKENDFALWVDGVEVLTDTSGNTFSANELTKLNLTSSTGIAAVMEAKLSQVQVFNTALSNFDLQNLTSNATAYATYETMRTSLNFNIQ